MRSKISLFVLLFVAGSLVLPIVAYAAAIPFFGPIIPPSSVSGVPGSEVCAAGWGMLITVVNNIIRLLITIAIVFVAPLMIAYAGFLFVVNPVNASGKEQAKKILTNTIFGIVIALASYIIVAALMAALYNPDATSGNTRLSVWSDLIGSRGEPLCIPLEKSLKQAAIEAPGITAVPPTTNCAASYNTNLPGITVSSTGNCCDKTQKTCTSLDGMLSSTIQQIINVNNKCGAVTVTGGTEVGHSGEGTVGSHSGGSKVDIDQDLISCVKKATGNSLITPPSFGSSQIKDKCGNVYTWEGNHTDIYVASACAL